VYPGKEYRELIRPGNADRRVGLSSTGEETMLPIAFQALFPFGLLPTQKRVAEQTLSVPRIKTHTRWIIYTTCNP